MKPTTLTADDIREIADELEWNREAIEEFMTWGGGSYRDIVPAVADAMRTWADKTLRCQACDVSGRDEGASECCNDREPHPFTCDPDHLGRISCHFWPEA